MAVRSRLLAEMLAEEYEFELPVSMIDVVFLLLIFFLCATKWKRPERKLDVNLPRQEGINPVPVEVNPPKTVKLKIDAEGNMTLDAVQVADPKELVRKLMDLHMAQPETHVVIAGEHKTPFHFIVTGIDACMLAGIKDVKFQGLDVRGVSRGFDALPK